MKIAVLISGGVDSSVALRLLVDAGHDVTAFYLKIWLEDELAYLGNCPWEEDLKVVRSVCERAGVPLEVVSLQKEYWDEVIEYTLKEVKAGRTPNPDMLCNQRIKFGAFYDKISPEFEKVATGHYARSEAECAERADAENGPIFQLLKSPDPIKDQTYFLAHLSQEQLRRALFPLGQYTKAEVRELAHRFNLPNADRKDSQGLCFLGKINFNDFLRHHLGEKAGDLIEVETGKKVGEHRGFWYYTLGQREGLGLAGGPWYVVRKDPSANTVFISREYHAKEKRRDTIRVEKLSWIAGKPPKGARVGKTLALNVKVRHGSKEYGAKVHFETPDNGSTIPTFATVTLDQSDQGLAPGQFVVFYDGEVCLGCGVMAEIA